MTVQLFEDTASTAVSTEHDELSSSTAPPSLGGSTRLVGPGLMIAGFLVAAALTAGSGPPGAPVLDQFLSRRKFQVSADSNTSDVECSPELAQEVRALFEQGASEFFEDGMHSRFSRALLATLGKHGRGALVAIRQYVLSVNPKPDVVSEALRWLADFGDSTTLVERWAILQDALRDRSARVRDGAILGFAALDDPRAIPLLQQARGREQIAELRRLLDAAIEQLNATAHAAPVARRSSESLD